ncbi:MAG: TIGR02302 family protein [Rhodospirillaceae bacterium]
MQPERLENAALSPLQDLAIRRRLVLAWLALAWERLWSRLWISAALVGTFIAAVLTDLLPTLPLAVHIGVLLAAAGAIAFVTTRRLHGFAWPTRSEARVRLETLSPVTHRPLTTMEDSLSAGANPVQQLLWRLHQRRAKKDLDRLRAAPPAPGIAARDHFAARAVVVLALFVGLISAWGHVGDRLLRGFLPILGDDAGNASVKLWITPPSYTNRSPLYIELPAPDGTIVPDTLEIPAGSKALVMVTNATRDASLALDDAKFPLDRLADQSQRGEMELTETSRLEVRSGTRTIAGWDVNWLADKAPTVAFTSEPAQGARWRFRIDYSAKDDYGVQSLKAVIKRVPSGEKAPSIDVPIALPPFSPKDIQQSSLNDLTALPWAGTKVSVQLMVTDVAGLAGASDIVEAILPERIFTHPVARELARVRKGLFVDPSEAVPVALEAVTKILADPGSFGGDPLVHLALSTSKFRFVEESPAEAAKSTPELLWNSAVRIEDGNVAVAEQRLRTAEEALRRAIERGASQEEIDKLVSELQQAVEEYQEALNENGTQKSSFSAKEDNAQRSADIAQLAEQLRQLSQMGSSDDAKKAFAELQAELDELRNNAAGNQQQNSQQAQAAEKMLQQMREIAKKQSELLDKNFKQAQQDQRPAQNQAQQRNQQQANQQANQQGQQKGQQQGRQQGQQSESAGKEAAASQEAIRQELESLMKQMEAMTGQSAEGLQDAQSAMRQAEGALRAGAWKQGVDQQGKALSSLEEGMSEAARQMAEALFDAGLGGLAQLEMGQIRYKQQGGQGRSGGDEVEGGVPREPDTAGMAQRVRAILDEIRNRASDRTRPAMEQEYLRRLMKQF